MSKRIRCAYMALKAKDMADAAMGKLPSAIVESCILIAGFSLLGCNPIICLYVMAVLAAASVAVVSIFISSAFIIRILGYTEVVLERLALA